MPAGNPLCLGAHVSASGGVHQAPARGTAIGADCIQIFTRNQRQWQPKPLAEAEAAAFREARADAGLATVMSHGSYLVNLAAADPAKAAKSFAAMEAELERCHRLGIDLLNFHPGAHMGAGTTTGIARIADALNRLTAAHPDKRDVTLVLENVAGQGTTVGRTFGELRRILEKVEAPERFAVCVDTAHAFAAGYDLTTATGWEATWREFERELGLERLAAFHVNDSAAPWGSRKDRHANLGTGPHGRGRLPPAGYRPAHPGAPHVPGNPRRTGSVGPRDPLAAWNGAALSGGEQP